MGFHWEGSSMSDPVQSADGEGERPRISTGSKGLDEILNGGLDADRMYLYEGRPGTGKTTHLNAVTGKVDTPSIRRRATHTIGE
jgi:predicted ATP-dependent serine protease